MKLEDAPPAGWYPDPERSGALRWWEGTDWSDHSRSLPGATEIANAAPPDEIRRKSTSPAGQRMDETRLSRHDADEIVSQVRSAAREEVDRAANLMSQRTRSAIAQSRRAVADYVDPVVRWIKFAVVLLAVAVIAWFIIQFFAQVTLLDWLGDRIDNLTD